jgi:hypothetical protein
VNPGARDYNPIGHWAHKLLCQFTSCCTTTPCRGSLDVIGTQKPVGQLSEMDSHGSGSDRWAARSHDQ